MNIEEFRDEDDIYTIAELSDSVKMKLISKVEFFKKYDLTDYQKDMFIRSFSKESQQKILLNKELTLKWFGIRDLLTEIIADFEEEKTILKFIDYYQTELEGEEKVWIIAGLSEEVQKKVLLENPYGLTKKDICMLLEILRVPTFVNFIRENEDFFREKNIRVYQITERYLMWKQLEFIAKLEETGLSQREKLAILETLDEETKEEIDTSNFPEEYILALNQKPVYRLQIEIDLNGDLEQYCGFDEKIWVKSPMEMTKKEKERFLQLCEICPNIKIEDELGIGSSTYEEYQYAEDFIQKLIQAIDENWTDLQKIGFVDYAIGQKISYSPDFGTEIQDEEAARALWKIIYTGYGVCDGISQVEKYILGKIGIRAEIMYSKNHAFLKLKQIQWIDEKGELKKGDTFLDPTWNLGAYRFGYKPESFCRSYEEIRKQDINEEGMDFKCHEINPRLTQNTIDLDTATLRRVFINLGIARKDGSFPIIDFIHLSHNIDNHNTLKPNEKRGAIGETSIR